MSKTLPASLILMATTAQMASMTPFSSALNCFSLHGSYHGGPPHPMMDMVEGVLQKRLDQWLANIFGEENPFFGIESGTCSQEGCAEKGVKLLGNYSGPFQIKMSSLPRNLSWTKLFWEKSGWRGEEGDALLEGLARNGIIEGLAVATSLLWEGFRQPFQKPVAAWVVRVGSDLNFRENAISLADKLRSPEDQVEYLQKNRISPISFNCPACDIVCERVKRKSGTNYFYFRCPNCHLERSIRTGTLLSDKNIEMRTFVLIAYFFVACFLTHQQLIHEVSLTVADGYYKTNKEKKTSCQTTVLYHRIFWCPFCTFGVVCI